VLPEVSATNRSLVHRNPTDCGVSECDREAWIKRRPWPTGGGGAVTQWNKIHIVQCVFSFNFLTNERGSEYEHMNVINYTRLFRFYRVIKLKVNDYVSAGGFPLNVNFNGRIFSCKKCVWEVCLFVSSFGLNMMFSYKRSMLKLRRSGLTFMLHASYI